MIYKMLIIRSCIYVFPTVIISMCTCCHHGKLQSLHGQDSELWEISSDDDADGALPPPRGNGSASAAHGARPALDMNLIMKALMEIQLSFDRNIWMRIIIGCQADRSQGDPLRGENHLLSSLINSYALLSTLIHFYPLLSTLIHSYPTLIQLLSTLINS